jgi:hypothetical protein
VRLKQTLIHLRERQIEQTIPYKTSYFAKAFVLLRKTLRRFARSVKREGLNLRKVEEETS